MILYAANSYLVAIPGKRVKNSQAQGEKMGNITQTSAVTRACLKGAGSLLSV